MSNPERNDPDRIDQEIRINELKHKAEELAGQPLSEFQAEDAPPEMIEAFWKNVVAFESGGWVKHADTLVNDGIVLTPPDDLSDTQLTDKLWEVIRGLAAHHTTLSSTDHLSDRELYTRLVTDLLHEESMQCDEPGWMCHLDILGSGSDEDTFMRHRYYASDEERERWLKEWPNDVMPPKEKPPYDRDRHLPQ